LTAVGAVGSVGLIGVCGDDCGGKVGGVPGRIGSGFNGSVGRISGAVVEDFSAGDATELSLAGRSVAFRDFWLVALDSDFWGGFAWPFFVSAARTGLLV
jgi:hypothetical protein